MQRNQQMSKLDEQLQDTYDGYLNKWLERADEYIDGKEIEKDIDKTYKERVMDFFMRKKEDI